jgi:hypothetical protein
MSQERDDTSNEGGRELILATVKTRISTVLEYLLNQGR